MFGSKLLDLLLKLLSLALVIKSELARDFRGELLVQWLASKFSIR